MGDSWNIRPARSSDSEALQDIEFAAGAQFREIGMPEIADDDPMSVERLTTYAEDGRSWVAVDLEELPIGYVVVDVIEGFAHVEQISVRPEHQRKGVGTAMLAEIERWAFTNALSALTLSTFEQVSWNAPLYARMGFRELAEEDLTEGLRAMRKREADEGLDTKRRVVMRRDLSRLPH
jgi:GNAT superfamily N-acetyltransferase